MCRVASFLAEVLVGVCGGAVCGLAVEVLKGVGTACGVSSPVASRPRADCWEQHYSLYTFLQTLGTGLDPVCGLRCSEVVFMMQ